MFISRHRRTALATVFLLLSFTAGDLVGDVLALPICAADVQSEQEQNLAFPSTSEEEGESSGSSPIHVDDCFCCSHCVENSVEFTLSVLALMKPLSVIDRVQHLPLLSDELFHPPQTS
jgi:hypothetical protein